MHEIVFYKDRSGNEPVYEYMSELARSNSKDSRVKLNKIREYIKALSANGTLLPENYVKHLDGDIWELRPTIRGGGGRALCTAAHLHETDTKDTGKRNSAS